MREATARAEPAHAPALELTNPSGLEIEAIMELLPHRYPMLLVDRITRLDPGVSAEGLKSVTVNEPYLAGHFPGHPIMPGVLIVDALAQVAGIMLRKGVRVKSVAAGQTAPPPPSRPGVLIVDALAQVAGIMLRTGFRAKREAAGQTTAEAGRPGVLAAIPRMRFLRPVLPGDQLRLHTRHVKTLGNTHMVQVEARVNGEVVTAGELVLAS